MQMMHVSLVTTAAVLMMAATLAISGCGGGGGTAGNNLPENVEVHVATPEARGVVAVSVSPGRGTTGTTFTGSCDVSGGAPARLEARCDPAGLWHEIAVTDSVFKCRYGNPGTYAPACRVDGADDSSSSQPVVVASGKLSVQGIVASNSVPLPDAVVRIYSPAYDASTLTDKNGQYTFYDVPSGTYSIVAARDNYTLETRTIAVP
jgi:hypothetical protein